MDNSSNLWLLMDLSVLSGHPAIELGMVDGTGELFWPLLCLEGFLCCCAGQLAKKNTFSVVFLYSAYNQVEYYSLTKHCG